MSHVDGLSVLFTLNGLYSNGDRKFSLISVLCTNQNKRLSISLFMEHRIIFDAPYGSSFVKKLSTQLTVIERLFVQLGRASVAVAVVEMWPLVEVRLYFSEHIYHLGESHKVFSTSGLWVLVRLSQTPSFNLISSRLSERQPSFHPSYYLND